MVVVILCALLLLAPASLFASPNWPNEPPGFIPVFDVNFDAFPAPCGQVLGAWDLGDCSPAGAFIAQDAATGQLSPPNMAVFRRIYNGTGGAALVYQICPEQDVSCTDAQGGVTEGFFGGWFKVSNPFKNKTGVEKVTSFSSMSGALYIENLGTAPDPETCVGGLGPYILNANLIFNAVFTPAFNDRNGTPTVKTNNCHLPGDGQCPGPWAVNPNHPRATFTLGVWHRMEVYFKYSTCDTCRNGTYKFWQDGSLVYEYYNMNYPPPTDGHNKFWITQAWDSVDACLTQDQFEYWDHAYFSKGPGTLSPGRLPQPTSVSAQ